MSAGDMTKKEKEQLAYKNADDYGKQVVYSIHDDRMRGLADEFWRECRSGNIFNFHEIQKIAKKYYGRDGEIEMVPDYEVKFNHFCELINDKYISVKKYVSWLYSSNYDEDIRQVEEIKKKIEEGGIFKSVSDELTKQPK